jgi:microcystin degradation protein MlrC
MADVWWSMRDAFVGQMISVEEAIQLANSMRAKHPDKPVGLLEMGDNVGGGSPGDGTWMVHGWLQLGVGNLLVVIADAEVVRQAIVAGVGGVIETSIGGKADPERHGPRWSDQFEVLSLSDGKFSESQVRHGGYNRFDQGPTAVLRGQRGVTVIATTLRMAPLSLQQVLSQHVRPEDFAAIVLKGVHAPTAAYSPVCSQLLRVNTMGVTTADLKQLDFVHRRRPMEPFERMERWR